jgi:hypothetical protein
MPERLKKYETTVLCLYQVGLFSQTCIPNCIGLCEVDIVHNVIVEGHVFEMGNRWGEEEKG